ncbi:flagellar protein FlgN [Sphingomonas sp. RT2P30]|uniref:flagellar protein FlgN n=1 Tax=Parasphingomonas halimpatiens TaxID=3096162 RepID=UPI002FC9547F
MTRRDALIRVIEALHAEIAALKANDVAALESATQDKLAAIDAVAGFGTAPAGPELRGLAEEANRLNETCRIYVNLMAANVRRRLQNLTGDAGIGGGGYRPGMGLRAYA